MKFFEIVPSDTNIDFLGKWRICVAASLSIIAAGLLYAAVGGIRWGLDFAGGTEIQIHVPAAERVDEGAVRGVVEKAGVEEPTVVRFGAGDDGNRFLVRFAGGGEESEQGEIVDRIQQAISAGVGAAEVERVEYVGPKVGADLRRDGLKALVLSWLIILAYVAFRFNPRYAPGGVIALLHDVLITASIWCLLGQPFDLQVLAALLAIIGYSINDTIVIYDRIRELTAVHTTHELKDVINKSINQTLSRTILTSGLTLLAVIALLLFAGPVVFPFSATMAIGIIVGSYSTVYIASPVMLALEQRYGAGRPAKAKAGARGQAKKGEKGARAARA